MVVKRATKASVTKVNPVDEALAKVREICLSLPETAEEVKHGRPVFTRRGKTFVMFLDNHHNDGRLALWCKATLEVQGMLVGADPEVFFVPPYVGPQGWIGMRLDRGADWAAVRDIVGEAYRSSGAKAAPRGARVTVTRPRAASQAPARRARAREVTR